MKPFVEFLFMPTSVRMTLCPIVLCLCLWMEYIVGAETRYAKHSITVNFSMLIHCELIHM